MKYRTVEILDETDPNAAGTHVIPLNLQDMVSRITLHYVAYPISTAMIAAIAANILKIELTDGSDVLYSMSGYECQALAQFDRQVNALTGPNYIAGSGMRSTFPIDFGRFKYDPELALNPARFHNLLLKITFNEDLMDASIDDHTLEIVADCFDEKVPNPRGFLSAKEWINYTPSAANAYKDVDLPTDEIIRMLTVRGYYEKKSPEFIVGEVRLSEEEKKRVVFDWQMYKYYQERLGDSVPIIERLFEYAHGEGTYPKFVMATDYMLARAGTPFGASAQSQVDYNDGGYVQRVGAASTMVGDILVGRNPHHSFDFPFGNQQDLEDWYDVRGKGSVILRIRAGTTAAPIQVCLQQCRLY